ncbi:MAG: FtsX-like permease family protein [Desulfobacterales bacterium]
MTLLSHPLLLWAVRDLIRRPLETLGLGITLMLLVAVMGIPILAAGGLTNTAERLIREGPAAVIRKVSPLGWEPIPLREAIACAASVPGVLEVRGRIWGMAGGPDGPVTIVGADADVLAAIPPLRNHEALVQGEAIVGRALDPQPGVHRIDLEGSGRTAAFEIKGILPVAADMAAFDVVLLHPSDARLLLDIPEDCASDLAVEVFHDDEVEAMRRELTGAFPWPVRMVSRNETMKHYRALLGASAGLRLYSYIPVVLGLCLVVATTLRERLRRRREIGLMKALGWTPSDIARLELIRSGVLAAASAIPGAALAYAVTFGFGSPWLAAAVFGWQGRLPAMVLDPSGLVMALVEISAIVVLPFLAASLGPVLFHAASPPDRLMARNGD